MTLLDSALMRSRAGLSTDLTPSGVGTLKHFFPCVESSGNSMTDTIGGVIVTPPEIFFDRYNVAPHIPINSYGSNASVPAIPLTSGSWVDLSTDSHCLLVVASLNHDIHNETHSGTVRIGDRKVILDVLPGVSVGISASNAEIAGSVNSTEGSTEGHYTPRPTRGGVADGVDDEIFLLDLRAERTGGVGSVAYTRTNLTQNLTPETETVTTPDSESETTNFADALAVTPDDYFKFRGLSLYGVALFQFSGAIPADYGTAVTWMQTYWRQGIKAISPLANAWT